MEDDLSQIDQISSWRHKPCGYLRATDRVDTCVPSLNGCFGRIQHEKLHRVGYGSRSTFENESMLSEREKTAFFKTSILLGQTESLIKCWNAY